MATQHTERPTLRVAMFLYGVGLVVLWIVALATRRTTWFAWIDLVGGALGLYVATVLPFITLPVARTSGLVFSLGIIVLWIVGLAVGVSSWLSWISFGLALALLVGTVMPLVRATRRVMQE